MTLQEVQGHSELSRTMINGEGKYIYSIIRAKQKREFGPIGIGGRGDKVYTIHHNGLAAVISSSPIVKYPVSRDNMLAHQEVLEEVMREFTLLPVRYCTIAEKEEKIKEKVLKARSGEFKDLLEKMKGKVELGVRALWTDTGRIFEEIVSENEEIAQLKKRTEEEKSEQKVYAGKIKIGGLVKQALEEKKRKEAQALLDSLRGLAEDFRENRILGDRNILNASFLITKEKEEEFDRKINQIQQEFGERTKLDYFGPIPPCNFVEVVVTW